MGYLWTDIMNSGVMAAIAPPEIMRGWQYSQPGAAYKQLRNPEWVEPWMESMNLGDDWTELDSPYGWKEY